MSIKKCFSNSNNKRLKELFNRTSDENIGALNAINIYQKELYNKLGSLRNIVKLEYYFPNKNTTTNTILQKIIDNDHPLNKLAEALLPYNVDTPIRVLSNEEYFDLENVAGDFNAIYLSGKKEIVINPAGSFRQQGIESTLLHEIIHSLTYDKLRANNEIKQDLQTLFNHTVNNIKDSDVYALQDLDEFMVALFTNAEFIDEIKNIPAANKTKYRNLFEEVFDYIISLFNINKKDSLYNEAFSLVSNIITAPAVTNLIEQNKLGPKEPIDVQRRLSNLVEKAYENFYGKVDGFDTAKYIDYIENPTHDTLEEANTKVHRMQEAFDAIVLTDTTLPVSGRLLASDNEITAKDSQKRPVIKINPNKLFADTVFHEFGHLYIDLLPAGDSVVEDAIKLLRGSELWNKVGHNYPHLVELEEIGGENKDALAKEVLATALGIEGNKLFSRPKETIWQQIKNYILDFVSNLFGTKYSANSLEKLASEMLTQPRLTGNESFNTLVDQDSTYKMKDPTQEQIDVRFKELTERFSLDPETHIYYDGDIPYNNSVTTIAKNITPGWVGNRKGSYQMELDEAQLLTKENFMSTITSSRIPYAMDKALNEFFKGEIEGAIGIFASIGKKEYWFDFYLSKIEQGEDINLIHEDITDNLEQINTRAMENQVKKELPLVAGNLVHETLEDYVKGRIDKLPERIKDRSGKLLDTIKNIIDKGEKEGSKFYAEQILFSEFAKAPGTADLIEITKDGKHRIYDFKTMSSFTEVGGKEKSDWKKYIINGYVNQLAIYSTILEEYGIPPADRYMNIISMEVDTQVLDANDPNSKLIIKDVNNENINPQNTTFNTHIRKAKRTILSLFRTPNKMDEMNLTPVESSVEFLIDKIQKAVLRYKSLVDPKTGKFLDSALVEESKVIANIAIDIKKLSKDQNKLAIMSYINNIREALQKVYINTKDKDGGLTAEYLSNLEFVLQAANTINDVKDFVEEQHQDFEIDNKEKPELLRLLNNTQSIMKQVQDIADFKTKERAINSLVDNSRIMEGFFAERYEVQAREFGHKSKSAIREYVNEQLKLHKDYIDNKEYQYWNDLLNKGYTDIRYFDYLLSDPGINSSQFVQVVKNIIDKVDLDVRVLLDNEIADLVNWHKALKIPKIGDPRKVWGKFIEKAKIKTLDGKTVSYEYAAVIPEFTSDYRNLMLRYEQQLDYLNREFRKAKKNEVKKADILDAITILKEERTDNLAKTNIDVRVDPRFEALSKEEQEALRFIHKKLEKSDERLYNAPYKKLVSTVYDDGTLIHHLPRKRQSTLESLFDTSKAWKNYVSRLRDFKRAASDEDDLQITDSEMGLTENPDDYQSNDLDILGNPLYNIPVYYRNPLEDPTLQSFDIPTLLAMNDETTIMYEQHKLIEADLFIITNSLKKLGKEGKVKETDALVQNNVINTIMGKFPEKRASDNNRVLKAVQASINNRFYKRTYQGTYSKLHYRAIKAGEFLNSKTSALVLAGNFSSATMTSMQGTLYRFIEGIAGEDWTVQDAMKGTGKAYADIYNMLADTQKQFPESLSALLIRRFGLEQQYQALTNKFVQDNFATKNLDEGALYAITTMAETLVTSTLMYTLMNNIKVMNKDGDFINKDGKVVDREEAMSIDEAYSVEDGKLKLNKHVIFTEFNINDEFVKPVEGERTFAATELSGFIRSKYADLYGQYNQDMKSVAEMNILGRLAFSMKKWIPRGYHRRFRGAFSTLGADYTELRKEENINNRFFSQDQKRFQEGFYTSGMRYGKEVWRAWYGKKLALSSALTNTYNKLTTHERANLKRSLGELAIITITYAASQFMKIMLDNLGDDDKDREKLYYAGYIAERLRIESSTFLNPWEVITLLQNPATAITTIERIGRTLSALSTLSYDEQDGWDLEEYDTGPRKGDKKVWRNIQSLIPYYRQVERAGGIVGFDTRESMKDSYNFIMR